MSIINAASVAYADMLAAFNASVAGDTILVPPGTADWSASPHLTLTHAVNLIGVGTNDDVNGGAIPASQITTGKIDMGTVASRISGFAFYITGTGSTDYAVFTRAQGYRVDHCRFENIATPKPVKTFGLTVNGGTGVPHPKGVCDHCYFAQVRVDVQGDLFIKAAGASEEWHNPLHLGTDEAAYFEDCTFWKDIFGNTTDLEYAGKIVVRHCNIYNGSLEVHSVQGDNRSGRKWEFYENNLEIQDPSPVIGTGTHTGGNLSSLLTDASKAWTTNQWASNFSILNLTDGSRGTITANDATTITATLSGGTHNKWDTGDSYKIVFNQFWAIYIRGGTGVIFNNTLIGNFEKPNISLDNVRCFTAEGHDSLGNLIGMVDGTSIWDGNTEANGYPGRDQIGRSDDAWEWTSATPYPPQALDAAYFWNNTLNGAPLTVSVVNGCAPWIQANRDYYENVGPKPGYTPLVYPHPLVGPPPTVTIRSARYPGKCVVVPA
jgi:hypothetical protein